MTAGTATVVAAARASASASELLAPAGKAWANIPGTQVSLAPTPLDAQPSAYVRAAWTGRSYGSLAAANLAAIVAGDALYLRLRWEAPHPVHAITDNNTFADACAILFPLDGVRAELTTMGDELRPVQAWHWRAGTALPFVITATGLGTASRVPNHPVSVGAAWEGGSWTVVFRRDLAASGVPLAAGASIPVGVAIWSGANGERAGIKAHTPDWLTLGLPK
jgi:DMSO reductase family type II enzyme heme b subunit